MTDRQCPDGGTCHHDCARVCFRVTAAGPLSGVFPDDTWPENVVAEHTPRRCYVILPGQMDPELGYIPSLVVEDEAGHSPLTGRGELSQPWYWGKDYDEAKAHCDRMNQQDFGLTPTDAADIVVSSMAAGNRREAVRNDIERKLGRL